MSAWPVEVIPDESSVYMRLHRVTWIRDGAVIPGAFGNIGSGMSCDWAKYSTPAETCSRSQRHPASEYAAVSMHVGSVRKISTQTVDHDPVAHNRAHSEIRGVKDAETRLRLRRIAIMVSEDLTTE